MDKRPTIVCLCGSTRFPEALEEAYLSEVMKGNIPLIFLPNTRKWHNDVKIKTQLDKMYKYKIDLSDEILVLNVGGYIGDSTRNEVAYARAHGKKVRYLEHNVPAWKATLNKVRKRLERR